MTFYEDMQTVASEVIGEFKQGTVRLVQPGTQTGPDWNPSVGAPTFHPVDATCSGVPDRLVDGTLIVSSDLMVIVPGDAVGTTPDSAWRVEIDGTEHEVVKVMPVPAAGTPSVYKLVARS